MIKKIESIEALGDFTQVPSVAEGVNMYQMQLDVNGFVYKSEGPNRVSYSLLVAAGSIAVEWHAQKGSPFVRWEECESDWVGEDEFGRPIKANPHWHYSFIKPMVGNWTQVGADDADMDWILQNEFWWEGMARIENWLL
ncbi:MAG: hypothetical protein AAGA46_00400 [Cyanobacteria bacterium P01_F01_bin.13]